MRPHRSPGGELCTSTRRPGREASIDDSWWRRKTRLIERAVVARCGLSHRTPGRVSLMLRSVGVSELLSWVDSCAEAMDRPGLTVVGYLGRNFVTGNTRCGSLAGASYCVLIAGAFGLNAIIGRASCTRSSIRSIGVLA